MEWIKINKIRMNNDSDSTKMSKWKTHGLGEMLLQNYDYVIFS